MWNKDILRYAMRQVQRKRSDYMEYPRKPTDEEVILLNKNKMREDNWLVIWENKKQIDFISIKSRQRRTIRK